MKDIVEAALNSREREDVASEPTESAERSTDGFGDLKFAVIGCGEDGIDWLSDGFKFRPRTGLFDTKVDFDTTTIAVGSRSSLSGANDVDEVFPVASIDRNGESSPEPNDSSHTFEGDTDILQEYDVAVVFGSVSQVSTTVQMEHVCRHLAEETLTLCLPVVSADVLTTTDAVAFRRLVTVTNTTIPLERSRVQEIFGADKEVVEGERTTEQTPIGRALMELSRDIFELLQVPIAAPVDFLRVWSLLESGGVATAHVGAGVRDDVPETLVEHATSHRLCDGETDTADGGLGVVRFGAPFQLQEFRELEDYLGTNRRPPNATETWCHLGGMLNRGFGDQCRLVLLFSGVDLDSVSFLERN
ncbi:hypothetical protein [Haloferax marisrubri]|uniref:Tubulin/FtsZ GTPase domain-containing protein n=1 Tax=Haloferax marisrubri TaxID=1544719 RepID=A0A2P4NPL4_9EURY|nr:hypothetical protein [Haloferax marisrubri]POG55093.1 hypothetical protein AUR65_011740 [Haloferax marisrubri]